MIRCALLELDSPLEREEPPDEHDIHETLKTEEHAVVLALRDTYMPGLDSSDAVMFATLLADLFPNVQVPLIFDNYGDDQRNKMQMNDQVSNLEEIPVLPKPSGEAGKQKLEGMCENNCMRFVNLLFLCNAATGSNFIDAYNFVIQIWANNLFKEKPCGRRNQLLDWLT